MAVHSRSALDVLVCSPPGLPDASLAIAGSRAGALGVLNLEFVADQAAALDSIERLTTYGRGRLGVLLDGDARELRSTILASTPPIDVVCLTTPVIDSVADAIREIHEAGRTAYAVVTSEGEAARAVAAGADALIAKGHEAGGWVGEESTFVLLQRLVDRFSLPIWAWGGVGLHTAAACAVGGAAGVVLDNQVLLTRESPLSDETRARIRSMDGSETLSLGGDLGAQFRVYSRPGLIPVEFLRESATAIAIGRADAGEARLRWRDAVRGAVGWSDQGQVALPLGQDAAFAADLADRFVTTGGVVTAVRDSARDSVSLARAQRALAEGSPLAVAHGVRYPIVQGPMTRVSDRAEFAAAVASAGGLPFLALALMRAAEVDELLAETTRAVGDRPWGVGVLGFVPAALRAEQLEVIRRYRPPFALIAGGRPDQARSLEADGIHTYLHVPSPGLLALYLKDGARRFVFEGRECGGHVGPRTSFVLWDTMVRTLLAELPRSTDASDVHVLFAGGIHDERSAAMVAAIAAPLVARGVRIGVLIGTAYLFTEEAVASAAITAGFQEAALSCGETVLLESGPGHATRCLPSPFVDDFTSEKLDLLQSTASNEEIRNRLEELNIGRLRIASKGVDRNPDYGRQPDAPKLVPMDAATQWQRGMYMIGQVAALRDRVITMADLHEQVSAGSSNLLASMALPAEPVHPIQDPARIAIVGVGTILPGASDVETFWANILEKVDAVTEIPASRWDWRAYYDPDRAAPDKIYSKWGGFIDDVPFDPVEFGMPPRSLESIEPFQLLGLLVVKAALENAGYTTRPFNRERTSVVFGAGGGGADLTAGYMVRSTLPLLFGDSAAEVNQNAAGLLPKWTEDSFPGLLMNVASGRIANRFDFGGANFTVDAACASSLAAVYLAIRDLQSGNSDMAVVGGVDAIQNPFAYLCFAKTQALSPTGRCRPFDANADGIAISEGFAALVLKRLDDAERDGDRIYAVIQGVGAASDGRDRSMTAPRPEGQMRALDRAYAHAGYSPATVGLFEAHGTGTVAGDQAEVQSLTTVLRQSGADRQVAALGSVKSMIGHTKATAGVAGLVKTALALHDRVLPATLGVTEPNPKADFPNSPLYVNTETRPWIHGSADHPRRAGVSAFGFGGTDFHLAIEEYDGDFLDAPTRLVGRVPAELLLWRATSRDEIAGAVDRLLTQLDAGATPALADLAYTLSQVDAPIGGPSLAIVAESLPDLAAKLRAAQQILHENATRQHLPTGVHYAEEGYALDRQVAFLFPGQGSQYVNMGRELAVTFPDVRAHLDRADGLMAGKLDQPLSRYIFPPPVFGREDEQRQRAELTETNVAQPALGATNLALARLLESFGVVPKMVAGHSYGEFVALGAAGSISDDDMLLLSEARGRFMREGATGESGTMAAVDAPREALESLLADPDLTLANLNSPRQTVISGGEASIARAIEWCDAHGLRARRLPVACAFHSPYVAPAQARLAEMLATVPIATPRIPVYSNTTAEPYPDASEEIAALLGQHLTQPVEWVSEIEAMYREGAQIFVEVGPKSVLTGLVGSILTNRPHLAISVDQSGRSGVVQLLHCLAALAVEGVPVRLDRLFASRRVRKLDLDALPTNDTPAWSASTWLVNGSSARPAKLPPRGAGRQAPMRVAITTTQSNGQQTAEPMAANGSAAIQAGAKPSNGSAPVPTAEHREGAVQMTATARNGTTAPEVRGHDVVTPAQQARPSAPATYTTPAVRPTIGADRVGEVMTRHQQVMQQFLETQRSVMLAYLGAYRPAEERPWIEASVAEREPVAAIPPPAPSPASNGHAVAETPAPVVARATPVETVAPAPVEVRLPEPPPAPPPDPTPAGAEAPVRAESLSRDQLTQRLLAVVSDRTGYPSEMLALDADLEADLGIDSIKRVEIAGTMMQTLPVPDGVTPDIEQITASRTLNQVVDALVAVLEPAGAAAGSAKEERLPFDREPAGARIGRFMLQTYPLGPLTRTGQLAPGAVVLVDDGAAVGAGIAARLEARGHAVERVDSQQTALSDAVAARDLVERIRARHGAVAALVHLSSLARAATIDLDDPESASRELDRSLTALFLLSQALREDLEQSGTRGGATVLVAIAQDGSFSIDESGTDVFAGDGALAGFVKTIPKEWIGVRGRAVDLGGSTPDEAAARVVDELFEDDGQIEVGYRSGDRVGVRVVPAPVAGRAPAEPLDERSVVLITGGARGITAEAALRLADRYRPTLILVGRTPIRPEDPTTAGIDDERALKRAIMERQRSAGDTATPVTVEREFRQITGQREVAWNLDRLRQAGARAEYLSCDVRDAAAFRTVIDDIYARYGRIDGVIHGAGIIEDKLIRDKPLDSFQRVIATKAHSAFTLVSALRPDSLRFVTFFSSVSGRFGNRGQADYAAANEVLNKLAQILDRRWPARVTAINWGPWLTTGMASEGVQRQFAERGVELIPLSVGCDRFMDEVRFGHKGEAEVVVGGSRETGGDDRAVGAMPIPVVDRAPSAGVPGSVAGLPLLARHAEITPRADGGCEIVRVFDPRHDLFLDDHRIDGTAVVPFAVALELMAEAAAVATPALPVAAVRDMRLMRGMTVDGPTAVRVTVVPRPDAPEGRALVDVTIASIDTPARLHYRALVELGPLSGPAVAGPELGSLPLFPEPVADVYRSYLFHGPLFQHIASIEGLGPEGARSTVRPSDPGRCIRDVTGAAWLFDPVAVDSALQLQLIWTRRQWDMTALPNELVAFERFAPLDAGERASALRHEMVVRADTRQPMSHADHRFYTAEGQLIAAITNMVGTGSRALNRVANRSGS